jgi:hypothetical protein
MERRQLAHAVCVVVLPVNDYCVFRDAVIIYFEILIVMDLLVFGLGM